MSRTAEWAAAWVGAAALGIANGVARDRLYQHKVGDRAGHQISTATLVAVLAGYALALDRHWPIPAQRNALTIGAIWSGATVIFEFGFGHCVTHEPCGRRARQLRPAQRPGLGCRAHLHGCAPGCRPGAQAQQ